MTRQRLTCDRGRRHLGRGRVGGRTDLGPGKPGRRGRPRRGPRGYFGRPLDLDGDAGRPGFAIGRRQTALTEALPDRVLEQKREAPDRRRSTTPRRPTWSNCWTVSAGRVLANSPHWAGRRAIAVGDPAILDRFRVEPAPSGLDWRDPPADPRPDHRRPGRRPTPRSGSTALERAGLSTGTGCRA